MTEKHYEDSTKMGRDMRKIDVDIEELIAWCKHQGIPLNARSRTRLVLVKLKIQMASDDIVGGHPCP
ncbi:hypothetical protein FJZ55_04240 [Candidatus Woesearchaeota archaeon]|nr:hypothetical protein [Candidatus Woesearchaeota archaeon]